MTIVVLAAIVLLIWVPYRRSAIGRAAYAVGSSEQAAYMSGVPVKRAKLCFWPARTRRRPKQRDDLPQT